MNYEILAVIWLLFIFFGCAGLYCFAVPCPILRKNLAMPRLEAAVSTEGHYEQPAMVCNFTNEQYRNAWIEALQGHYYGTGSEHYTVASYLGDAVKLNFAISGKYCTAWWQNMIKATKPQSPTCLAYYEHIPKPTPYKFYVEHKVVDFTKNGGYGGNGYGKCFMPSISHWLRDNGINSWLKEHYKKYPNGILPEQTMTRCKVK